MRVAQISFFQDPQRRAPAELLEAWPTLVDVADAAAGAGVQVTVIQANAGPPLTLHRNGVDFRFMPLDGPAPPALIALLAQAQPEVMHVHGLGFARHVLALAALAPRTPIVLQDQADRPPRRFWRWPLWRRSLGAASGLMFCAAEQARPFRRLGLLPRGTRVFELAESSSRFEPQARAEARLRTCISGCPALLWVGHLNENKDPLTVLDGVSLAARHLPGLQLWCCFGSAPLMERVQARIDEDPWLRGRVHLRGQVPHAEIERLMSAADFLVQGSHRESTGYSVIEALACGLPPVVTDIPSFRALTGGGRAGVLWPRGDSQALAQALLRLAAEPQPALRVAARAQFDRELSQQALGAKLRAVYQDLLR